MFLNCAEIIIQICNYQTNPYFKLIFWKRLVRIFGDNSFGEVEARIDFSLYLQLSKNYSFQIYFDILLKFFTLIAEVFEDAFPKF